MQEVFLNLLPNGVPPVCYISQYDGTSRVIRFRLLNGTEPLTLSGSETITLNFRKPNREEVTLAIENTSSNYIDLVISSELSDKYGEGFGEFRIQGLGTLSFKMYIESDAYGDSLKSRSIYAPIATFETDLAEDLIKLDVDLEPIQDLHGYDNPWPAGGGKNLLNIDAFKDVNNWNSSYPDSGAMPAGFSNPIYTIGKLVAGQTYTLSFEYADPDFPAYLYFGYYDDQGVATRLAYFTTNRIFNRTYTFTAEENLYYCLRIQGGVKFDENMAYINKCQLELGSSATSFAPYSNICPISGHDSAQLFRTGKNLLDKESYEWINNSNIIFGGTNTTISDSFILSPGTYTLSCSHNVTGFYVDNNDGVVKRAYNTNSTTFSISSRQAVRINFYIAGVTQSDLLSFDYQLELGSTATTYEPYESDPTPITVQFGQTVYKGKLYSEQRKVLVTHVCETFDGSSDEQWVTTSSPSVRYGFRIYFQNNKKPTARAIDEMLSSAIPLRTTSEAASVDDDIITCRSTTYLHKIFYIFAPPSKISTVNELRAFLANEPETVMYPLDEPFFIDLTQIQTASIDSTPVASFETTLAMPLNTSEHNFSCSQAEGTPTPDNPIPITGVSEIKVFRTGKNLITANVPTDREYWGTSQTDIVDAINSLPVGTYTISNKFKINELPSNGKVDHGRIYITAMVNGSQVPVTTYNVVTDNSPTLGKAYSESGTFTITEENKGKINHAYLYCDQSTTHSGTGRGKYDFYDLQVELGSTATPYEPYSGESITVSLGGTYYGGKLVQSEDGSRKIVLDKAFTKINALTWTYVPSFTYFNAYPTNLKQNSDAGKKLDGLTSDIYANRTAAQAGSGDIDLSIAGYQTAIRIKHKAYTDANSFVAAVGDHDIVYPLETPIEITLPDGDPLTTLAGENNVYCNTGDTALTYYYNMVADPIRIPALVGTNNVYSDAGDVDVEYYTTLEGGND